MGCCDDLGIKSPPKRSERPAHDWNLDLEALAGVTRRTLLKGVLGTFVGVSLASTLAACNPRQKQIRLAFCSQLLCVVPYEFTRSEGFFEDEGLEVEYVYSRGGSSAMQALVGGAVDYAATSLDVALQAFANDAPIQRFATTGRLPLFALATAPEQAEALTDIASLAGTTVGVSGLGNADHVLVLYLLEQAGVAADSVRFATIGTNLYDALRTGQLDAGMVQEPALSLLQTDGGRVLFNGMELEDAERFLGGSYEFMGVAFRTEEREERLDEMRRLARALQRGLDALRTAPIEDLIAALPGEIIAGSDEVQLGEILERYRLSLYPETVVIDPSSSQRVLDANQVAGLISPEVNLDGLLARDIVAEEG